MRKKILILILCHVITLALFAQKQSITWQDLDREYIVSVPEQWDGERALPMIFMLHGLGGNIDEYVEMLNIQQYSNTTGWMCVLPQALPANVNLMGQEINLGTLWNAYLSISAFNQSFTPNSNIDDEGFLLALIDSLSNDFNINEDSIFLVGGSMGAIMTNVMAVKHSDLFAGIASISGSMPINFADSIVNNHLNVLCIHGTNDQVIDYENGTTNAIPFTSNVLVGLSAEELVEYWKQMNDCQSVAVIDTLPDRCEDNLRFVSYKYSNDVDSTKVEFIKVLNGEHSWYTNANINDIDYPTYVYNFFSNNNIPYMSLLALDTIEALDFSFYPNPATDFIQISCKQPSLVKIIDFMGRNVMQFSITQAYQKINISSLKTGVYFICLQIDGFNVTKKLIIK